MFNVDFMNMVAGFLHCRLGMDPLKYQCLLVGTSPRRFSTWQLMIDTFRGNKLSSFRSHIVLQTLFVIVLFVYLFYLNMPSKVWKFVVQLQREFLWGDTRAESKVLPVKWVDIFL